MPTVIDATVVNQAYDTSGNGGRKLVRLSNGWLVALLADQTNYQYNLYKSTDNGQTWSRVCYIKDTVSNTIAINGRQGSIVAVGNKVKALIPSTSASYSILFFDIDPLTQNDTNIFSFKAIIDIQIDVGACSLAINEDGTELHAAWASKNSTYPNSFNIRYAKGTINADGSVTWGAVEQLSTYNNGNYNLSMPTIVVDENGKPTISLVFQYTTTSSRIVVLSKAFTSRQLTDAWWTTTWGNKIVYDGGSYTQFSPSACVDKNGRIWVAWEGYDSTDTSTFNIRVAYSDDGGATWSTPTKLTSGNSYQQRYPTITCDKNNNVYVLWHGLDSAIATNVYNIRKRVYSSGSWGSTITVTNSTDTAKECMYPSALYDPTFSVDFSSPLFIYQRESTKVGFYGTWVITTISVPQGYIGQKTSADKSNILSYSITTDGTMSTITEKINGTTIATRTNPTSGQQFTVSLNQAQWDAIKYGNAHTLTITMGSDTWTYTFDKRLNANDDILSAVKGVQDLKNHLNGIKAQLAAAIRAKGGTVNDTDAFTAMINALSSLSTKRQASGTGVSSGTSIAFKYPNGTTTTSAYLTVTGLTFKPSMVVVFPTDSLFSNCTILFPEDLPPDAGMFPPRIVLFTFSRNNYLSVNNYSFVLESPAQVVDGGFTVPVGGTNRSVKWYAFE